MKMQAPSYYEEHARTCMAREDWPLAADYWMKARGASVGHNRRDRYERLMDSCLAKADEVGSS
jgi:hypothetical protein